MKAKTELFLYIVSELFGGSFGQPPFSRFRPFEHWGYADQYHRQLHRLRQQVLLEAAETHESKDRIYRLTERAGIAVRAIVDLRNHWSRPWDHTWRLVMFDLPESRRDRRDQCRRELRRLRFGCLQGSVWVSPDPVTEIRAALEGADIRTNRLLFIEGRPAAGESDIEIVQNAWDFPRINKCHAQYQKFLLTLPDASASDAELQVKLPRWVRREFLAWKEILAIDPLLPAALLPADYAGRRTWEAREETFRRARALAPRTLTR
jgi:phenylacetic acid degradation operon negative regulatory protein